MDRLYSATIFGALFILIGLPAAAFSYAAYVPSLLAAAGASTLTSAELEALKCRGADVSTLTGGMFTGIDRATLGIPENPTPENDWCLFLQARKNPKGGIKDYGSCATANAWRARNKANDTEWAEIRVNFDPKFGQCLKGFIQFLENEKGLRPLINSGVRTGDEQNEIWDRSCQGTAFAASPPGSRSSHNIGLAADLQLPESIPQSDRSALARESGFQLDFNVPNDRPHVQASGAGCSSGGIVPKGASSRSLSELGGGKTPQGLLGNLANLLRPQPPPFAYPPAPLAALPTAPAQIVGTTYSTPVPTAGTQPPVTTVSTSATSPAKTIEEITTEITAGAAKSSSTPPKSPFERPVIDLNNPVALVPPEQTLEQVAQGYSPPPQAPRDVVVGFSSAIPISALSPQGHITPTTFRTLYVQALNNIRAALLQLLRIVSGNPSLGTPPAKAPQQSPYTPAE